MAPFVSALDAFHEGTRPSTWLEGLVKAYVGDGLATDFYREVAAFLPDPDRALVLEVLADTGHADFAVREVRAAIAADRRVAGRLALWGRRLVGEAITQSQAVIAEHDGLADLIMTGHGRPGRGGPADRADHRRPHPAHGRPGSAGLTGSASAAERPLPRGRCSRRTAAVPATTPAGRTPATRWSTRCCWSASTWRSTSSGAAAARTSSTTTTSSWTATGRCRSDADARRVHQAADTCLLLDEALEVLRGRRRSTST